VIFITASGRVIINTSVGVRISEITDNVPACCGLNGFGTSEKTCCRLLRLYLFRWRTAWVCPAGGLVAAEMR